MLKQSLPFLFPRLLTVNCYNRIAAGVYGYPAAACFDVPVFPFRIILLLGSCIFSLHQLIISSVSKQRFLLIL